MIRILPVLGMLVVLMTSGCQTSGSGLTSEQVAAYYLDLPKHKDQDETGTTPYERQIIEGAKANRANAQYQLAMKFLFADHGTDPAVEYEHLHKANYWFRKAADQGHAISQEFLARLDGYERRP